MILRKAKEEMLGKLKKCKNIKEIYDTLGWNFFEKIAMILLMIWCMLPIVSFAYHLIWADMEKNFVYRNNIFTSYQDAVVAAGALTAEFLIIYFIGKILLRKKSIKISVKTMIKERPWNVFFALLLVWIGACSIMSADHYIAFWGTEYRFEGFLTYLCYTMVFICAQILKKEKYRKIVLNTYAIVSVFLGVCMLLQENALFNMDKVFIYLRATVFCQFNHMGYYLNMSILVMVGLFFSSDRIKNSVIYGIGIAFQLYCLLVNNTFGAYLGSLIGLISACIMYIVRTKNVKKMLIPVAIYIVLSGASIAGMIPSSSEENLSDNFKTLFHDTNSVITDASDSDDAGTGRMILWRTGLKMVPESPVFGYGPEQINPKYTDVMGGPFVGKTSRPENEYIQYMMFMGIPGLILYLGALICLAVCQLKRLKRLGKETVTAAGCAIGYAAGAFVGNSMYYTTPYMYMFLGLASKNE